MAKSKEQITRDQMDVPCPTPAILHHWVDMYAGIKVPTRAVCKGHSAPFEYLIRSYFEPACDQIVWAPRGGGKTRLGAIATLLDLVHKPGVSVRILGGSMEQSLRMWEHLHPNLESVADHVLEPSRRGNIVRLQNDSMAAVLTQSERAVRGLRIQKLRCDEVELFKPHIWQAAQLVTRSIKSKVNENQSIGGTIEALSTLHAPYGLMQQIIDQAQTTGTPIVRWCIMEVLEHCPPERDCKTCPLWDECHGVAKLKCDGFVKIDDAISIE
jgi:hypothetical protein